MTNNFDEIDDNVLRIRQAFIEHKIETKDPDGPEAKNYARALHNIAQERRRRALGESAASYIAQLQPGGQPIDTDRWREE